LALLVFAACCSAATADPSDKDKNTKHLNKAIDKGDVKSAEKALTALEKKGSEKAAQTEQMVLDKVKKETDHIEKMKHDAAHADTLAKAVLQSRKKHPGLTKKITKKQLKRTKTAIREAKVADAQRAVARLSRKDAEGQVMILHHRQKEDELRVKAAEGKAAEEKSRGDAAVAKLSKELKREKSEVQKAKAEAAHEMQKSEKVDEESGFSSHLTKKQLDVKKTASKHVAKAKARVAKGYTKMKQAESDAAVKVHKYERIKSSLMDAESKEMHSKQVESQKMASLSKAKRIEQRQEAKLKSARKKAADETRNALYVAFGKQGITNAIASPLRKELAAALKQEKTQAKQIAHLQSLESQGFKQEQAIGREVAQGSQCQSTINAVASYEKCIATCTNNHQGWYGEEAYLMHWLITYSPTHVYKVLRKVVPASNVNLSLM